MTQLPAVVTIPDLGLATTLSSSALFEAAQTTNGIGESVAVPLSQLASAISGIFVLPVPGGGTGTATITAFGIPYGRGTTALGVTAAGTTAWPMVGNGTALAPSFQVLSVLGGGTGTTTLATAGVLYGNGTGVVGITAAGATALPLVATGGVAAPTFAVLTVPGGGTGTTTLTVNRVLVGAGTTTLTLSNVATSGFPLVGNGTAAAPGFAVLGVPGGGLGTVTTTPFGVLFGGSTATSQVQSIATTAASGLVLTSQGSTALPIFTTAPLFAGTVTPQGRLTLSSGVPVMGASQASIATAYYTPYIGNLLPLSDGSGNFSVTTFSEMSQGANNTTLSPAAVAASSVYDVFAWQQNATTVVATRGFAWQNMTTRGSTAALVRISGVWLNTNAVTNGPAAQRGTYLGTLASDGSSVYNYIFGAVATGCTAGNFAVWNCYNRVNVSCFLGDATSLWAASTTGAGSSGTWRAANNSATARVNAVRGLDEDGIKAVHAGGGFSNGSVTNLAFGIGLNTTGAFSGSSGIGNTTSPQYIDAQFTGLMGLGYNFISAIELNSTASTATFFGTGGATFIQTGLHMTLVQ